MVIKIDNVISRVTHHYQNLLATVLNNRLLVWPLVVTFLVSLVFMFTHTASELAPQEDQGVVILMGQGPSQANTDYLSQFTQSLDKTINSYPETEMSMMVNGYQKDNQFFGLGVLKDWDSREASVKDIMTRFQKDTVDFPGLQVFTISPPDLPGTSQGLPFQMVLKTPTGTYEELYQYAEQMKEYAVESGKFIYVQNDLEFNKPQLEITINRDKAALMNVNAQEIGNVLTRYVSEGFINYFALNERSYQVITQVKRSDRSSWNDIDHYYVRSNNGTMVPLAALIAIKQSVQPSAVDQFQQLNSATIEAKMMPGVSIGEAYAVMQAGAKQILPASYATDSSGQLRQYVQEGASLVSTFALALVIIYLVLAAQFESFKDPLIVLTSVPLSIFGAMIPLYLGVDTLNYLH